MLDGQIFHLISVGRHKGSGVIRVFLANRCGFSVMRFLNFSNLVPTLLLHRLDLARTFLLLILEFSSMFILKLLDSFAMSIF